MPKKAVATFFLLAFIGAVIFIYITWPRTKDQIPTSNNQRPFPSAPVPSPPTPNSVPVPEPAPAPNTPPKVPPGPKLHVMAWANPYEARALQVRTDAFGAGTGHDVDLRISADAAAYARDVRQAIQSGTPPDVCLVAARDFAGLDPSVDFADMKPAPGTAPRSLAAFTVGERIKAAPDEFSVNVLFYNPVYFDQAGIGYPGPHWTWDILDADARALQSQQLKDAAGEPIYAIELPADFDLWNVLCTQSGHPALDLGTWHVADDNTKESQMRALELIREIFQGLNIAAPVPKPGQAAGVQFGQQRAALFLGPSDLTATLPNFGYRFTLLPSSDIHRASLARVNGWAVTARAPDKDAARALAGYLATAPVHAGWTAAIKPAEADPVTDVCYEALGQSLVPRIGPRSAHMADFLDQQINLLARDNKQTTDALYARIQTEFQGNMEAPSISGALPHARDITPPAPKLDGQLRGM